MQKRCTIGKSCGATCIDRQEDCIIELGPEVSSSLSKVRDFLTEAKSQTLESYEALDTPKKAAEWLLKNKEKMAAWGLTDEKINNMIKTKPAMITFGIEPGVGPLVVKHLGDMRNEIPALKETLPIRDLQKNANGPWGDQLLKANSYKLAQEASGVLNKMKPQEFPKELSEAGKQLAAAGMNVDAALKYLQYAGLIQGDKVAGFINYDANVKAAAERDGKILWETANGLIQRGAGLQGQGIYGGNPSGLWKPSKQFGQFQELFDAAGMSKQAGPFASNAKWYKYSGQQLGNKVMKLTREAQPKLMYFGGKEADAIREKIRSEFEQNGTFGLKTATKDGKPIEKQFEYFVYKHPDGSSTVAMFGPHTGALGFASNRKLMEAVGEAAKGLIEGGVLPRTVPSAELVNVSAVKQAGPRNVAPVAKATREKQVAKAVKEMKGEVKPAKPQVDKAKQLAAYKNIAEGLKNQGFGAVRIREELRKMGVPAGLISEVV